VKRLGKAALLACFFSISGMPIAIACGPTAVCTETGATLTGVIVVQDVTISWSTDEENSDITSYVIRRYNCGNPNTCSTYVTSITPAGSCGTSHNYSYTDTPPTPVGQWIYTVEVWRVTATRACAIDVAPQ
jgi:hypothetical protein